MKKLLAVSAALLSVACLIFQHTGAQQNPPQGSPRGQQGQGQGRGPGIEALALDDRTGFESIFDGKTLKGWDGDPQFWRVENETIIG